jgi:hypothetical protein
VSGRRRKGGKGKRDPEFGFYEEALLREVLRSVEGGGIEAMARMPDNLRLLLRGTDVLSRAAAAEHRMSPKGREELAANVKAVLDSLGDQLL